MSNPLKGFCSGSFVGEGLNFSSLGGVSGEPGGDTLPLRLLLSSEHVRELVWALLIQIKTGRDAQSALILGRIAAVNLSKEKNAHFSERQITAQFCVEWRVESHTATCIVTLLPALWVKTRARVIYLQNGSSSI